MRASRSVRVMGAVLSAAAASGLAGCGDLTSGEEATAGAVSAQGRDLGAEVLAPGDGWASFGAGTSGGSLAVPDQIFVVRTRAELIAALNNGVPSVTSPSTPSTAPKIIYVDGTIDFNVDDANQPLSCVDYQRNGYTREAFLATYDPEVWGRLPPSGPVEAARVASQLAQQARVRMRIGSNTTIVGVGHKSGLRGVWLDIRGSSTVNATNIIVRNLTFQDTSDCFPVWSPNDTQPDGTLGAWNALYDFISLRNADHVWIDHNTFEDVETADQNQPSYFGVLFQTHDGTVDITNASDLVTVSFNRFQNHAKVMLIGSSDGAVADRGKLRTTVHHNLFDNIGERAPRVRFGQVHVYNNDYRIEQNPIHGYSWGVGIESAIYAENNLFKTDDSITPDRLIARLNGTTIFESGTLLNDEEDRQLTDVVAAWNAVNDPDLTEEVGWIPSLVAGVDPTGKVPGIVQSQAGPLAWRR